MPDKFKSVLNKSFARYAMMVVIVAASFLLRFALVQGLGLEMPTFITFYPAVMLVAILAGLWPGILATVLVVLGTVYLILPPVGHFTIARASDAVALALFAIMGVFMSLVAEDSRRKQRSLAEFKEQQALRKSEVLYHNLFNSMYEGFCLVEVIFDSENKPVDYRFLEVNARFESQTGLLDAVGKRMRELAPDHEEFWFNILGNIALTGEPAHFANAAKSLNRFYQVSAYRVDEPELHRVAIVFMDVSERKRAEQHIKQLNRVYAMLSDINQAIVREKDTQKMMEAACRIAVEKGKFRMAWIGMVDLATRRIKPIASCGAVGDYLDRVRLDLLDPARTTGPSARCFLSGKHVVCNSIEQDPLFAPWRDDALRMGYQSHASFPLKVDAQVVGIFNLYTSEPAFFDEDELKLLDEMAMDISFALEVNRHESAHRELEDQLRQVQKMEAIGQLTGGIAHDFNNLLTVIIGCSEVLGDEVKENPRQRKITDMILGAAQRGADLTHRMLAFARCQTLQPSFVNVNKIIKNLESILRHTFREAIELDVHQSEDLWEAIVDPSQLESALLNLCVNSQDAMPNGGKLTIETSNTTLDSDYAAQNADLKPGQYVLVSVSDTGTGIKSEILSKVFDPFFTTKEVGKGTGLGLSMVYGFVKQSQGHVKIYSEPGIGTSVKLFLPKADRISDQVEELPPIATDLRGTEVILLVEDDDLVREFAISQLAGLGYKVLEAANGNDAMTIIRERPDIDLLFTDVVMPGGLNGGELAQEARKIRPGLNVLFTSGYAESAIVHKGLLDKDVQLLSKPYSRQELANRIRGAMTAR